MHCTCKGNAISITCVMAAAGKMGLYAGKSVAEAGCSFIFITCTNNLSKTGNSRMQDERKQNSS